MLGKTIGELYDYCCLHYRERTALTFNDEKITFGELEERGTRLANSLVDLGFLKGDTVAMMAPNIAEVMYIDYASAQLGLSRVPLAAYLKVEDMLFILKETKASTLIYHEYFATIVDQIKAADLPDLKIYILATVSDTGDIPKGEHHLQSLIKGGKKDKISADVTEEDMYVIAFTGGTTGVPKGVMHNHRTFVSSLVMELLDFGIGTNEKILIATPLTHGAGVLVMPICLRGGSCIVLQGFDPKLLLETIQKEKITMSFLVPTMLYALMDHPDFDKYDLSSLNNIIYGAAPIPPERLKEAVSKFGKVLTQLYGQSEAPMALAAFPKEDHIIDGTEAELKRLASCGKPTLLTRLKLLDDDGNEVKRGETGEIVVKAPNIMLGYLNRPELTAETIVDGWLHTGDVAYQDEEGYLYIVDRKKDMIVSGGFNIFPKEVEDALGEHPSVAVSAVIGVPHEKWGEAVKAVVQLKPGKTATEEELIVLVKDKKGSLMAPKSVDFVDVVPVTLIGKLDKKTIRAKYWEGKERRV